MLNKLLNSAIFSKPVPTVGYKPFVSMSQHTINTASIPIATIGLFLPFRFKATSDEKPSLTSTAEPCFDIVPLICSPNPSYQTHSDVFCLRGQLESVIWRPNQHRITGHIFHFHGLEGCKDEVCEGSPDVSVSPICAFSNVHTSFGSYSQVAYKDIEHLHKLVCESVKEAITDYFDDAVYKDRDTRDKQAIKHDKLTKKIEVHSRRVNMTSVLSMIGLCNQE